MKAKNILIVGYPKSGTTWLSRLVADLLQCPLVGDWGYAHIDAPYALGANRASPYRCFKSHHTCAELNNASNEKVDAVIYVSRDPRDIVVSGMNYFGFLPKHLSFLRNMRLGAVGSLMRRIGFKLVSEKTKKKQMLDAVLIGNKEIDKWLALSWQQHMDSYKDQDVLWVAYEDVLKDPALASKRILDHLGIQNPNEQHIVACVEKHRFSNQKNTEASNQYMNKLLRGGRSGDWQQVLSTEDSERFRKAFGERFSFYKFA